MMNCALTSASIAGAVRASSVKSARSSRSHRIVVCQVSQKQDAVAVVRQAAFIAGAALLTSTLVPNAEAKESAFESKLKYEEELLSSIKSRTGKDAVLPELKSSPKVEAPVEKKKAVVKKEEIVVKKEEAKPSLPSLPAAAPKAQPAPVAASTDSSDASDNKGLIAVGGIALLAVAGLAAGNNGAGPEGQTSSTAPSAAGASDVPPNVQEARAWIAAWKKKHGKA